MKRYFVDASGDYLGSYDDADGEMPIEFANAIEIPKPRPPTVQRFYVDADGKFLGSFDGLDEEVPADMANGIEVPTGPVDGRQRWNGHEWLAAVPTSDQVDAERDRRIDGGFSFNGVMYQSRPSDRENIAGASTASGIAMVTGSQAGNYRWHGGDEDFAWIASDNSTHPMDAQTMFAFGQAAMAHKSNHIFAARALKDMTPIPADYATNPAYWP